MGRLGEETTMKKVSGREISMDFVCEETTMERVCLKVDYHGQSVLEETTMESVCKGRLPWRGYECEETTMDRMWERRLPWIECV